MGQILVHANQCSFHHIAKGHGGQQSVQVELFLEIRPALYGVSMGLALQKMVRFSYQWVLRVITGLWDQLDIGKLAPSVFYSTALSCGRGAVSGV